MRTKFAVGDRVIYTRDKYSNRPGPRAKNVSPTPHGETYTYQVDKFWVVSSFEADGALVLRTRRGKQHTVPAHDPRLRKARWWEKLLYANRFPEIEPAAPETSHGSGVTNAKAM